MEQVNVGGRIYTVESIHQLLLSANTAEDERTRAGANFELGAIQVYAALVSAQSLAEIARNTQPVIIRTDVSVERPVEEPEVVFDKDYLLEQAEHEHEMLQSLRQSTIIQGKPAILQSVKHGTLKVFMRVEDREVLWDYTLKGEPVDEARAISVLDAVYPPASADDQ